MLTVDNVTKRYKSGGQEIYALNGVSLTAKRGEFLAVIGKSGCGKSTLLHIISGLSSPTSGAVLYEGEDITALSRDGILRFRAEHIGIILQNFSLLNDRTVHANVELPLKIRKMEKSRRDQLVREYLDRMDMLEYIDRYPKQLSGGQNSGRPLPGPWSVTLTSCWRMSQPAPWTMKMPCRSSISCEA